MEKQRKLKVGLFDSGIGGLSVLEAIKAILPNENFIYLGDTARNPYGSKPKQAIIQFSAENTKWLLEQGVKMIMVACNTASVIAGNKLKGQCPIPVITMTDTPQDIVGQRIGLIGTKHVVDSWAYPRAKTRKVCQGMVSLVEQGKLGEDETESVVAQSLIGLENLDILILGCTHYSFLQPIIRKYTKARIIDPALETAKKVKWTLTQLDLLNEGQGKVEYYFTGHKPKSL